MLEGTGSGTGMVVLDWEYRGEKKKCNRLDSVGRRSGWGSTVDFYHIILMYGNTNKAESKADYGTEYETFLTLGMTLSYFSESFF